MHNFYCWIAVLTPSYEPIISHSLLHLGYKIGAANENNLIISNNVLIYQLGHTTKSLTEVEQDINNIITSNKMKFHLVVVTHSTSGFNARSRSSNISYMKNIPKTNNSNELEIDIAMKKVNDLLAACGQNKSSDEKQEKNKNS